MKKKTETMNKFVKQVLNSVAVQAAVYAVTEGGKLILPKAKAALVRVGETMHTLKSKSELNTVIKNTENKLEKELAERRAKKQQKSQTGSVDAKFTQ